MKVVIPVLILMSLLITEAFAQTLGPPTNVRVTPGDLKITVTWGPPSSGTPNGYEVHITRPGSEFAWDQRQVGDPTVTRYEINDYENNPLVNGIPYQVRVAAVYPASTPPPSIIPERPSAIITVTLGRSAAPTEVAPTEVAPAVRKRRRVIQKCPVGWVRSDGFAGRNRRVLLYEVNVEMDLQNRVSIYKPVSVAIYVHPDEALENLDGWKLQVALPYNHHREYLLTAENSVVVDAGFVEGGFAFIENPEENPFPMTGIGFTGAPAPGFDYRLYDEIGRRVDFGISCYKRGDVFYVLKDTENPRVLRKVPLEDIDWNASWLIRSEWTVPTPAPAAPSLVKKSIVGTWADLKKQ